MDSSSSSNDEIESSETVAERVGGEDVEVDAVGAVSEEETVATEATTAEETITLDVSSGEEVTVVETSINEDTVSMDELKATEASSDDATTISASNPKSIKKAVDERVIVGAVASAVRTVETTLVTITSSGGTAQGNPSRNGNRTNPSLFDSSPSTLHYVRRAQRVSMVSTDSKRTISATTKAPTPPSSLQESGGIASTPVVIAATVSAAASVQRDEAVPVAAEWFPVVRKFSCIFPMFQKAILLGTHQLTKILLLALILAQV